MIRCGNWLSDDPGAVLDGRSDAVAAQDLEVATHGGPAGIRDEGLLESALAKAKNLWACSEAPPSLARRAASYASGMASNHPFVDGNKRTALIVSFVFLDVNGIDVTASQEDAYLTFLGLAAGEIGEAEMAVWFELNSSVRPA